jgi:exo-beta-1,3-glucanase (GH17 family)
MNQNCGFTEETVEADLTLLATLTKRVRVYSSKCEQGKMILKAITKLKLDVTVTMGGACAMLALDPAQ